MKLSEIVLDVLKPHEPNIIELAKELKKLKGVKRVEIIVEEIDELTESTKMIIAGSDMDFESIKKKIEEFGASIHSIDKIVIEDVERSHS